MTNSYVAPGVPRSPAFAITLLCLFAACGGGDDGSNSLQDAGGGGDTEVGTPDALPGDAGTDILDTAVDVPDSGSPDADAGQGDVPDAGDVDTVDVPDDADVDLPDDSDSGDVADASETTDVADVADSLDSDGGIIDAGEASVFGRVSRPDGTPVEGASVQVGDVLVATTNAVGEWTALLERGVPLVVVVEAPGHTVDFRSLQIPVDADEWTTQSRLVRRAPPQLLSDSSAGGTVTGPLGARVVFPPNAVVDERGNPVTGAVTVEMTPLNYTIPNEFQAFPGGPAALLETGEPGFVESFGVVEVELTQSGEEVFIADGASVTLDIPVTQPGVSAGTTIPLWSLNEETGLWESTETGTVVSTPGGLVLRGEVEHFSWWNADMGLPVRGLQLQVQLPDETPYLGFAAVYFELNSNGVLLGESAVGFSTTGARFQVPGGPSGEFRVGTFDGRYGELRIAEGTSPLDVVLVLEDNTPRFTIAEADAPLRFPVEAGSVTYLRMLGNPADYLQLSLFNATFGELEIVELGARYSVRPSVLLSETTRVESREWRAGDEWLLRIEAESSGEILVDLQDATLVADALDADYPVTFSSTTARLEFFAPAGTWLRAVATVDGLESDVTLTPVEVSGGTLQALSANGQFGDTGAFRTRTSGIQRIEYQAFFGDSVPRAGSIRLIALDEPTVVDARTGATETIVDDGPFSAAQGGSLFYFGYTPLDVQSARIERTDPDSATPALMLSSLSLFGAFGGTGSTETNDISNADILSTRISAGFETGSTGVVFVTHRRGGSGDLTLFVDSTPPAARHRVGDPAVCEGATTRNLWTAAQALLPGGTVEVCPGEHLVDLGSILPGSGTLVGLGDEPSVLVPWSSFGWTPTPSPTSSITVSNVVLRSIGVESGVSISFAEPGTVLTVNDSEIEGIAPGPGAFTTTSGIQFEGGGTASLRVENSVIRGFSTGISFPGGLDLQVSGSDISDVANGIAASSTRNVSIIDSTLETRNTSIFLANLQNGNTTIQRNTIGVSTEAFSQSGIFVTTGPETVLPVLVQDNRIIARLGTIFGIVVSHNADDALRIENNWLSTDGGTLAIGIDVRDPSTNALGAVTVAGNLIQGARDSGIQVDGIDAISVLWVLNNTVQTGGSTTAVRSLIALLTRAPSPLNPLSMDVGNNLLIGSDATRDIGVGLQSTGFSYASFENRAWNTRFVVGNSTSNLAHTAGPTDGALTADPALNASGIPTTTDDIVDAAEPADGIPAIDLRGTTRPLGAGIDIGAIEIR